jgi:hypothetical protein
MAAAGPPAYSSAILSAVTFVILCKTRFERPAQFSQHLKDCGDDAGKRLMTRSSNHSICLQQRLVWTWWLGPWRFPSGPAGMNLRELK